MALSMSYFNLPDKRKYTKNLAFNPFAGGRQNFEWTGGDHGLNGEFKETCLSCTYNGSTLNWGSGNVWVLGNMVNIHLLIIVNQCMWIHNKNFRILLIE